MEKQSNAPLEPKPRKVTVYNTVGSCEVEFSATFSNRAQLCKELDKKGIPHKDMKMVVGEDQQELLSEEDEINVQTDISLFLTPIKVKSGWFKRFVSWFKRI